MTMTVAQIRKTFYASVQEGKNPTSYTTQEVMKFIAGIYVIMPQIIDHLEKIERQQEAE